MADTQMNWTPEQQNEFTGRYKKEIARLSGLPESERYKYQQEINQKLFPSSGALPYEKATSLLPKLVDEKLEDSQSSLEDRVNTPSESDSIADTVRQTRNLLSDYRSPIPYLAVVALLLSLL